MSVHGLFVGIDKYPTDSGFSTLRFACSDASKMQSAMIRTPTGMDSGNAALLTDGTLDGPVKRNDIITALDEFASSPGPDDTLLFYFAGHGFHVALGGGKGWYLAPADVRRSRKNDPTPETAISLEYVRSTMMESAARYVLLIIDACRTDSTSTPRGTPTPEWLEFGTNPLEKPRGTEQHDKRVCVLLSACRPETPAGESERIKAGLWTHSFCTALDQHAEELEHSSIHRSVSSRIVYDTACSHLSQSTGKDGQTPRRYALPCNAEIPLLHKRLSPPSALELPWQNLRAEIDAAQSRISTPIGEFETPGRTLLKRSRRLEDRFGCRRLYFKLENVQNTGSFKYRGATNAIERLHKLGLDPVIVAASAGNHGLGVAVAAKHRNFECHIFIPEYTPLTKSAAIRNYTPNVIPAGEDYDNCQRIAMQFAETRKGAVFVHPFNDPYVVAGQGTIGLELLDDWAEVTKKYEKLPEPDFLIVPCGGGGLLTGVGTIISERWKKTKIVAVEPEGVPSLRRAMEEGSPILVPSNSSIADGIAVRCIGSNTLPCIQKFLKPEDIWGVSEKHLAVAILSLMEDARVLAEGAGAAGLAGMIKMSKLKRGYFKDKVVICLISGGNVDISSLSAIVSRGLIEQDRRAWFEFDVPDRPGALADITRALADARANIVGLVHHRHTREIGLNDARVDVEIETHDAADADRILRELDGDDRFKVRISKR